MTQRERWTLLRALLVTAILTAMFAAGPAPRLLAKGGGLPRAERLNAAPTPSGAEAAYPLNHTFDASGDAAGTPPPNHDFEAAGSTVGTPPANHDFSAPSTEAGTPPANHTFEATPDFAGWTVSGTTSIQSDSTRGRWAKLGGSGTLTSSAFTVDPSAQAFVFDVGWLPTGWSYLRIHALTGPDFATSTELKYMSSSGSQWRSVVLDATTYRGQTIKLKFSREGGEVGIDNVRTQVIFPQWDVTGEFSRQTEASGNAYAELAGGALISSAFTVDAAAQTGTVRMKGLTTNIDQYYIYVLSGPTFATSTRMPPVERQLDVPVLITRIAGR